ncbi:hypothetical protein CWB96_00175 [Pseudoalteromonas citrea]|uniref:Uncharacterized protein n=1 Tax=Pseudoalteromonas citrea TaxID=43655 RepID=A0A5S3XV75_9GAMM|nr:hypothetical protein [Pseudoalteromonas citrea]TMP46282.1 hypothetical protein CWB97_02170 [Pseudoalteromonas citrea]TMP63058.1 hypothetical protein CWB96_00175 [Pseudoalteromonas citrea]
MNAKQFNATFQRNEINITALLNTTYHGGQALLTAYEALEENEQAMVLRNAAINVGVMVGNLPEPEEQ